MTVSDDTPRKFGKCVVVRTYGAENGLRIERADPKVRLDAELLQEISVLTIRDEPRWSSLVDDVLTIRADNRTVVYRIDWTDYDGQSFGAEWPD